MMRWNSVRGLRPCSVLHSRRNGVNTGRKFLAFGKIRSFSTPSDRILWHPTAEAARKTQIVDFALHHAPKYGYVAQSPAKPTDAAHASAIEAAGVDYFDLWRWSVADLAAFYAALWDYLDVKHSQKPEQPLLLDPPGHPMAGTFASAQFYPGARLNFAENVLRYADDAWREASQAKEDKVAMLWYSETRSPSNPRSVTFKEMRLQVLTWTNILRDLGVKKGDTVCGFLPILPETNIVALAAIAIGAVWSSCSPDFGEQGTLDRFSQIEPKVLFATAEYYHKGKRVMLGERVGRIAEGLSQGQGGLRHLILLDYDPDNVQSAAEDTAVGLRKSRSSSLQSVQTARELNVSGTSASQALKTREIAYEQVAVDHPVYTMFSSGTTGLPKCLQQGFGVWVTHAKEHRLLLDLRPSDRYLQYTTTGWMMWNYALSALSAGTTLVLYEGDPMSPSPAALYDVLQHSKTTVFGTSARYLAASQASGATPRTTHALALRTVLSTGSAASEASFLFASSLLQPGPPLHFLSISGGTEINGCLLAGSPILPVRLAQLQAPALGMEVAVVGAEGQHLQHPAHGPGELSLCAPASSQPLRFLHDDARGSRYRAAYFDQRPPLWSHGDFAQVTESGGVEILGRSDTTLNPGGVRIGTGDIYGVVERELADLVQDCVAVGRTVRLPDGTADVEVVLFIQVKEGATLGAEEVARVRATLRAEASPRHVPAHVLAAPAIPVTANGKKVEVAVRKAIAGEQLEAKSRRALANPECLDWYYALTWD